MVLYKKLITLLMFVALMSVSACGGGGGGSDNVPAGLFAGKILQVSSSCDYVPDKDLDVVISIEAKEAETSILELFTKDGQEGNVRYTTPPLSELGTSFVASFSQNVSCGQHLIKEERILSVTRVNNDTIDITREKVYTGNVGCLGIPCRTSWSGRLESITEF